jgi:hypothetical protein
MKMAITTIGIGISTIQISAFQSFGVIFLSIPGEHCVTGT